MRTVKCNYCGSVDYEEKNIEYLYSHKGKYLLVPDTPVEVCSDCGMLYYDSKVLKKIEEHFFDIQTKKENPDSMIEMPVKNLA